MVPRLVHRREPSVTCEKRFVVLPRRKPKTEHPQHKHRLRHPQRKRQAGEPVWREAAGLGRHSQRVHQQEQPVDHQRGQASDQRRGYQAGRVRHERRLFQTSSRRLLGEVASGRTQFAIHPESAVTKRSLWPSPSLRNVKLKVNFQIEICCLNSSPTYTYLK